jgi:plasmid stabilization system protein ParE
VKVRWASIASRDLAAALEYLESQRDGTGVRLLSEIDRVVAQAREFPRSYPRVPRRTATMRQAYLAPFEYLLTYEIGHEELVIASLWYARRRPPRIS